MDKNNKYIITLRNLSVGYNRKPLATNVNLSATKGSVIAVMGRNGSGKSTLIKTIAGLLQPVAGEVVVNGIELKKYDRLKLALNVAVVLTDPVLVTDLTVVETVSYGRYPHTSWLGRLRENDMAIINRAIEDVGLKGFENRVLTSLSDGERQRVMIAKGLAQKTPLMLLDEPTSHLDLLNRNEIVMLLKKLADEKEITVVFSTHEIDLVKKYAGTVWLFGNNGKIYEGTPAVLLENGLFSEVFGKGIC